MKTITEERETRETGKTARPSSESSPSSHPPEYDPELSHLARFLAWLGIPAPYVSGPVLVRVARVERIGGYYGYTLQPANAAARELLGETDNGHFATPADARRRAVWNYWEVVE